VINYGGGVFVYFTRHLGARGDFRFLRDVGSDDEDDEGWGITDVQFSRGNVGLVLAW
jgi:hypothetical protein